MYYSDKIETLRDIFGTENISVNEDSLEVDGNLYPVIDDVVILCPDTDYTPRVSTALSGRGTASTEKTDISVEVQYSFGHEWQEYPDILPEHESEFRKYFDIIDLERMKNMRVCDLGCGSGRWSYFLKNICREIILVDFSDAIFTARDNLRRSGNTLFFMCNLQQLPFRDDFTDFLFSLGVLHHLPTSCLDEVRHLKKYSPILLIFLYYALDNRPVYFRLLLKLVTAVRLLLSKIKNHAFRKMFSFGGAVLLYLPLVNIGHLLQVFRMGSYVPLYDFYKDKSLSRIEQDVYDRFFTSIEQRVTKKEIMQLKDTYREVNISEDLPYWHFTCLR